MPTTTCRNLHVYSLNAPIGSSIYPRIASYDEGIGISSDDIPAEGTINVLVYILRANQGTKGGRYRRVTELTGDSPPIGVHHPHFGVSFGVDAAALKVQSASDMHVLRSRTQNTHMPKV
jgi:hypothetical protein